MESPEHLRRDVIRYMELEAADEPVTHAERVISERVISDRYDVWDVHTDKGRWWVITPLTNLYSQTDFPSAENVLTFHIGLGIRVMNRQEPRASARDRDRTASAWRKWVQAASALDQADEADEAEDFQAIGMRLREAMISFVREIQDDSYLSPGTERPKAADVVHWIELIANRVFHGESGSSLRSHLKKTAKSTWELVNWLTHAVNAIRTDAEIALNAVENLLSTLVLAVIRFERGAPNRCPECSSYRITLDYRELPNDDYQYVSLCEACGWERVEESPTDKG